MNFQKRRREKDRVPDICTEAHAAASRRGALTEVGSTSFVRG